ncbi:uncharacterized protein LOC135221491 [Macrobrachium nipponense]|uniref:uncharacterized protein LOC135221491 n=1 Tax=Macrobrachium nipponense TaxID=159736 RepID=UPI0030C88BCC
MRPGLIYFLLLLVAIPNETFRQVQIPPAVVVHEWLPGTNNQTITMPSSLLCAMISFQNACIAFDYQDQTCALEGCNYFSKQNGNGQVAPSSVFMNLVNVAKNKPTYSNPSYPSRGSKNVVDDNNCRNDTYCGLMTYSISNPWFLVDIGTARKIFMVDLGPCTNNPISRIEVRIGQQQESGNFTSYQLFGSRPTFNRTNRYLFSHPDGILGRFVSVQSMISTNFYLCDLEVLALSI